MISQEIRNQIIEKIDETFAEIVEQEEDGKIADVSEKLKRSKSLMEKAYEDVIPIANNYLNGKSKSEKEALINFIQERLEMAFGKFVEK